MNNHRPGETEPSQADTPRLTAMWQLHADLAKVFSAQLLERERSFFGADFDPRQAAMLRGTRAAVDYYGARFVLWPTDASIDIERKAREQREWSRLTDFATTLLAQ